jgi:hypothetical protein
MAVIYMIIFVVPLPVSGIPTGSVIPQAYPGTPLFVAQGKIFDVDKLASLD